MKKDIPYVFTDEELKALALFFRNSDLEVPQTLSRLSIFAETYIYNQMTISEAEAFFTKEHKKRKR
ncbi:hypothetical protein DWQ65_00425 [Treponema phagedenis]|uniref:Uncharacterized protein n=1 Tax=Treponema phagedenis TaxID=162 RepID=A0A0B7GUG6_TREPH|nr:hypothetical protein [Treponema phagedenis]EFW37493.1 hypothetical protein HMPREF9554_02069 [Treponema phagedenis F0421]NVP24754.1 hypothetical protein [Treponema phagedenis]QEJ96511.1 hypothetical protein FUT79_12100 [Treponema phagedenis]QEJ99670.1 hypothetical protein FUT82_13280 [Treponema phagedenis]QEK02214.1 hypothetical protein FUT84_04085 [Treponema phagedenis]